MSNHEQTKNLVDNALDRLGAALEAGASDTLLNYLAVMARFHRYSGGNCLLIATQRPTATRVAGFHAWKKLNRYVKKGAKGIAILAPMVCKKKSEEVDAEDEQTRIFGFRTAHVFDGLSRELSRMDHGNTRRRSCLYARLPSPRRA
jgi:hypothetical protein